MSDHPSMARHGFTLVELAIVLVIVGLIIGGVLVGQDMIKGAETRATAGQFEKYNAAVNVFRDKYRVLAGDMNAAIALQFGLPARPSGSGAAGQYDGNGKIEGCAAGGIVIGCETVAFWEDLNAAGLTDSTFNQTLSNSAPTWSSSSDIALYVPAARLGRGSYIVAYASGGAHYYQLGGLAVTSGAIGLLKTLSPLQSFNIDTKLDDGKPTTGATVAAVGSGSSFNDRTAATLGTDNCIDTASLLYLTTNRALAETPACALRVRFN